jgi:hypothetical protein
MAGDGARIDLIPDQMQYAASLTGQPHVLEHVAPCFAGTGARIRKLDDTWLLESPAFEQCAQAAEVFPIADDLVRRFNCILAMYSGLTSAFTVGYIQVFNSDGTPKHRGLRNSTTINVYSGEGIAALSAPHGTQSLGSAIAEKAIADNIIQEALNLYGSEDLTWPRVYDIIEFLGGAEEIAKATLDRNMARVIRQTANHHRHLGSPKKYPVPATPPTLREASGFVCTLLKRSISSRL